MTDQTARTTGTLLLCVLLFLLSAFLEVGHGIPMVLVLTLLMFVTLHSKRQNSLHAVPTSSPAA